MEVTNNSVENKFLYDRWVTTILFSVLICICGIGLCVFGFLLFNNDISQEGFYSNNPVPITSSANSVNRLKNGNQNSMHTQIYVKI